MADLSGHRGRTVRLGLSRREFLQQTGRGGMGFAVWGLLAACTRTERAERPAGPSELPPLAHELDIAQWPLYIDRARDGHRPTLEQFEQETGIDVAYREVISDNASSSRCSRRRSRPAS